MMEEIRQLIAHYAGKGILIDTNILLLYFIGSFNQNLISRFKRTLQFIPEDYDTLLILLHPFARLVTTPNILTEVSNLSGHLGEPIRTNYFQFLAERIPSMEERYINSASIVEQESFKKIGLTDTGILEISKTRYLVLTDDFRLSQTLQSQNIDVVNFNHIRVLGWE